MVVNLRGKLRGFFRRQQRHHLVGADITDEAALTYLRARGDSPLALAVDLAISSRSRTRDGSVCAAAGQAFRVAFRMLCDGFSTDIVTAAVLHNILEDSTVTLAELRDLGVTETVVQAVCSMTYIKDSETYHEFIQHLVGDDIAAAVWLYVMQDRMAMVPDNLNASPARDQLVAEFKYLLKQLKRVNSKWIK